MTPVTIDAELVAKLTSNGGRVPLTGPDGKLVGYFVSADADEQPKGRPPGWMHREPTLEEFRQSLANSKRWYTTEDVLKLLEE
jgi:hypothetical protein